CAWAMPACAFLWRAFFVPLLLKPSRAAAWILHRFAYLRMGQNRLWRSHAARQRTRVQQQNDKGDAEHNRAVKRTRHAEVGKRKIGFGKTAYARRCPIVRDAQHGDEMNDAVQKMQRECQARGARHTARARHI